MAISLKCSCGKTLKVDEKHRGKKAKCPACGTTLLVEEQDAETAVQAEKPKKRPVASRDDDDESDVPKPIKRRAAKSNKMMYMIGGGCGLLLLLTCCVSGLGLGVWYFFFRGGDEDLIYVHEGVLGFISIRGGDIWKSPVVQDQLKLMPADAKREMDKEMTEMETKIGLKMEDLERATIIFRSIDIPKTDFGAVLRTSKPMDRKKIIEAIAKKKNQKEKEVKHDGGTIYVFGGGMDALALYFATDRIVLLSDKEDSVKDFLRQAKKPAKNPALVRGVQMASSGKHQLVAAFELKRDLMDKMPPEVVKQVPNLRETNGVILAGTLAKDLSLEAVLTFATKDVAGKAKGDVDHGVTIMKAGVKAQQNPGPALVKFMDSITVEQRSAEVVVKARVDLDVKGFGEMPDMFFGGKAGGGGPLRLQSTNNLKQIGLGILNFHDVNKSLPNHAMRHPQTGQSLLSWRVAILPYIEQQALYQEIRHNEPWNSAHNSQFWNRMPMVYQLPGKLNDGRTYYQVFHGDRSAFPKAKRQLQPFPMAGELRLTNITDGTSNTIFVVEAANPVNWMAPDDIPFQMGQQDLINRVGNHWGNNTFLAGMGDGTVRAMRRTMMPQTLQALITRDGADIANDRDWEP